MTWVKGVRTDYPKSLRITDDAEAYVEFVGEPNEWKKSADDIRYHVKVKYYKGTATCTKRDEDEAPAVPGIIYTLWLSQTLGRGILKILHYVEGDLVPKLTGTKWKIWRSQERHGGHRLYAVAVWDETITSAPVSGATLASPVDDTSIAKTVDYAKMYNAKIVDYAKMYNNLKSIKEIDLNTWNSYCTQQGLDPEVVTAQMVLLGFITKESTKIIFK